MNIFEKKIKSMFLYVGSIGAVISAISYIAIVLIMVFGTAIHRSISQTLIFAGINAGMGLIIMQFLKIQGIDLAKNQEENVPILADYNSVRAKEKKVHSLRFFWITSITKDIIIKCATLAVSTIGIVYVVIYSSQDYSLLLLALVNLFMFACFGLLALVKAYDFFNEDYIPFLKERINERNNDMLEKERQAAEEQERAFEAEVQKRLEMAKKECFKQVDDCACDNNRDNLLVSSMDSSNPCNIDQSVVLDNSNDNHSVLVCSTNPSCDSTNYGDCANQKDI